LRRRHLAEHGETFVDRKALLGAGESLELRAGDDEGEADELAEELLKVETTFLDEN